MAYFKISPEKEPTEQQARDAASAHFTEWLERFPSSFEDEGRSEFVEEEWDNHLHHLRLDVAEPLDSVVYDLPLSKFGDLMTVEAFRASVECRLFIDYDGYGRPVKDGMEANFDIYPSRQHLIPLDATHFIWFNR